MIQDTGGSTDVQAPKDDVLVYSATQKLTIDGASQARLVLGQNIRENSWVTKLSLEAASQLIIDDTADSSAESIVFFANVVDGLAAYPNVGIPEPLSFSKGISSLAMLGGSGADTFTVLQTSIPTTVDMGSAGDTVDVRTTNAPLNIAVVPVFGTNGPAGGPSGAAGDNDDGVNVGSQAPAGDGSLAGIKGAVTIANTFANMRVVLDDSADQAARTASLGVGFGIGPTENILSWSAYAAPIALEPGPAPGAVSLEIDGGSGNDTFNVQGIAPTGGTTLIKTAKGQNTVNVVAANSALTVVDHGHDTVTVGAQLDTLDFIQAPLDVTGAQGVSTNLYLDDQGATSPQTYTLAAGQLQLAGGPALSFAGVSQLTLHTSQGNDTAMVQAIPAGVAVAIDGGSGQNMLAGTAGANTWSITDPNAGVLDSSVAFQGFGSLLGGTAGDTFLIGGVVTRNHVTTHTGGTLSGTLDGGAGANILDYSAVTGNVTVDLPLGTATDLGGVRDIQNVVGSQGSDVLVGTTGTLSLKGGTGRNLLIAGPTPAILTGSNDEDILVGGTTAYDSNPSALAAIMAEWTRTDLSYAAQVQHLLYGGGNNGLTVLNPTTFNTNGGHNTLTGGPGLDLFYGFQTLDKSDWNPQVGEIFVNDQTFGHTRFNLGSLSIPSLWLDGNQSLTAGVSPLMTLTPGTHTLSDPVSDASVQFTVAADGTVGYAAALEGILTGGGTTTLAVHGVAVTIDATALSSTNLLLSSELQVSNTVPLVFTDLPGGYVLQDTAASNAVVAFTLNANGTVGYEPALEGVLTGGGTTTLAVHGVAVTIDATALSSTNLLLSSELQVSNTVPLVFTDLPGGYVLQDTAASNAVVAFTLNANGTVGYEPALEGILTGGGTTTLAVHGVAVTIDATALSSTNLLLSSELQVSNTVPLVFTDLPGGYVLQDTAASNAVVAFTLNANGTVGYEPALEGILTGAGTTTLAVHGATITVDATTLSAPLLRLSSELTVSNSAPFTFTDLPGNYVLQDMYAINALMDFTLNPDGTVSYDPALQSILTGNGTSSLVVQGVTVHIDATAVSQQASTLSVDGADTLATAQVQTITVLPGTVQLQVAGQAFNVAISTQDELDYDTSLDGQLSGRGTNTLVLSAIA